MQIRLLLAGTDPSLGEKRIVLKVMGTDYA